jgi:molybdenum cofactor synthesis domain-containing protein
MDRMISPDRAFELVMEHLPPSREGSRPLADALGFALAESIQAPQDFPSFPRAMMDGYAVRVADAGTQVQVSDLVAAGHLADESVGRGRCIEIMTGAPCPSGTEAVVMFEDAPRTENHVQLPPLIRTGQHVQSIGELCRKGTVTLEPGTLITPLALGHLAAFNYGCVRVFERPKVAVISTGDELVPVGGDLLDGQIRDSNGPMLVALVRESGASEVACLHARDTEASLSEALESTRRADIVVLTGGVSMGKFDLVPKVVSSLGASPIFHKVAQKPGKPLLFATNHHQAIFGLPGNARSTHFCFTRYVAPAIRSFCRLTPVVHESLGDLVRPYQCKSARTLFMPMRAEENGRGGWHLRPFDERGSADIYSTAQANVYVRFEPGQHALEGGTTLPFFWMGPNHG